MQLDVILPNLYRTLKRLITQTSHCSLPSYLIRLSNCMVVWSKLSKFKQKTGIATSDQFHEHNLKVSTKQPLVYTLHLHSTLSKKVQEISTPAVARLLFGPDHSELGHSKISKSKFSLKNTGPRDLVGSSQNRDQKKQANMSCQVRRVFRVSSPGPFFPKPVSPGDGLYRSQVMPRRQGDWPNEEE